MKVQNCKEIEETEVTTEGAQDARMRLLISEKDGAEKFAMRMFTVEPGGHTPYHAHNYEHEVFVLEGQGLLKGEEREYRFGQGAVIFIKPNEKHQFSNVGSGPMTFLCLIPAIEQCT
ncbi:MAG: cupin domain-containing protein [bacterium]